MMKKAWIIFTALLLVAGCAAVAEPSEKTLPEGACLLSNETISVAIGEDGSLLSLRNVLTDQDYASGGLLWRLYYDSPVQKEIQVLGSQQKPRVSLDGDCITLRYDSLSLGGQKLDVQLTLSVCLEEDKVRFGSEITNNEPHTVVREFQYPLLHGAVLPAGHKLFTSEAGGKLYDSPVQTINRKQTAAYKRPEQIFRQKDVKYGAKVFMNCFGLFGENQGLYFGSHDDTFQDTWHGLRAYKGENGDYDCLEFGFYKYPHCFCGESWSCNANVIAPYSGSYHVASRIYRAWADTWWDHRQEPRWVREMTCWQRVIFKHQYGEYLFKYPDINGKVDEAGRSVDCRALMLFGWWEEGMDHGNPDYSPDRSQGGDEALRAEIARYQAGGNHLLLYYNGKLIDRLWISAPSPAGVAHSSSYSTSDSTLLGTYTASSLAREYLYFTVGGKKYHFTMN